MSGVWKSTPERVRLAAERFNDESDPHPAHTIARELNTSTRTAHRLVARARGLGLITRTAPSGTPKNPLVHGTVHGYQKHGCRCEACRAANNALFQEQCRTRAQRGVPPGVVHNANTYKNWGCRCDLCSAAHYARCRRDEAKRHARVEEAPHGTTSAYESWGCRCDDCRAAAAEYRKRYRKVRAS